MIHRHYYLFLALLLAAHVAGCQSSKPIGVVDERAVLLHAARSVGVDSISPTSMSETSLPDANVDQSTVKPGLFRRLFPAKSTAATASTPRKCKGCTFNYVQGNQSNATIGKKANAATGEGAKVAVAGKKAQQATDSAVALSTGGGAAAVGAGAHAEGGAVVQEAKDWKAELASPVGQLIAWVAGLFIVGTGIYCFVLWRKKKQAESILS